MKIERQKKTFKNAAPMPIHKFYWTTCFFLAYAFMMFACKNNKVQFEEKTKWTMHSYDELLFMI